MAILRRQSIASIFAQLHDVAVVSSVAITHIDYQPWHEGGRYKVTYESIFGGDGSQLREFLWSLKKSGWTGAWRRSGDIMVLHDYMEGDRVEGVKEALTTCGQRFLELHAEIRSWRGWIWDMREGKIRPWGVVGGDPTHLCMNPKCGVCTQTIMKKIRAKQRRYRRCCTQFCAC